VDNGAFDRFVSSLQAVRTRKGALRSAVGAALAGLSVAAPAATEANDRRRKGRGKGDGNGTSGKGRRGGGGAKPEQSGAADAGRGERTWWSTVTIWGYARCAQAGPAVFGCSRVELVSRGGKVYSATPGRYTGYFSLKVPKNAYYTIKRRGTHCTPGYCQYSCCRTSNYWVGDPLTNQQSASGSANCVNSSSSSAC
jgi:hypothetical protein